MYELISRFLKTKNTATRKNYKFYLERFLILTKVTEPENIDPSLIRSYQLKLNRIKGRFGNSLSPATQNYHLIALRAFLKFLNQEKINYTSFKKIYLAPLPLAAKTRLEKSEIEDILSAPEKSAFPKIIKKRDKAILETLYSTSLKVSRLASLKINETQSLSLSNQARYSIREYLKERTDHSDFLFVRHDQAGQPVGPLTPRSIQRIIQAYRKLAGLKKKVTPETLRKTLT